MGLFALEIWLHPKELQCLLDILDQVLPLRRAPISPFPHSCRWSVNRR
jgi:hypothetical protein